MFLCKAGALKNRIIILTIHFPSGFVAIYTRILPPGLLSRAGLLFEV
jgi:hypothetical protein